jgi:hypothetical protein
MKLDFLEIYLVHMCLNLGTELLILWQESHADAILVAWGKCDAYLPSHTREESLWHGHKDTSAIACMQHTYFQSKMRVLWIPPTCASSQQLMVQQQLQLLALSDV